MKKYIHGKDLKDEVKIENFRKLYTIRRQYIGSFASHFLSTCTRMGEWWEQPKQLSSRCWVWMGTYKGQGSLANEGLRQQNAG